MLFRIGVRGQKIFFSSRCALTCCSNFNEDNIVKGVAKETGENTQISDT